PLALRQVQSHAETDRDATIRAVPKLDRQGARLQGRAVEHGQQQTAYGTPLRQGQPPRQSSRVDDPEPVAGGETLEPAAVESLQQLVTNLPSKARRHRAVVQTDESVTRDLFNERQHSIAE